jgi:L-ribulokinase
MARFVIGADYGTNSARFIIADTARDAPRRIVAEHVYNYQGGEDGIILDPLNPLFARQDPREYFKAFDQGLEEVLRQFDEIVGHSRQDIVGIGFDTTGSTPIPVDGKMNPTGDAWLWKDKTSGKVATAFNQLSHARAREGGNADFTKYTGGLTSPEWIFSKLIQMRLDSPEQFNSAASFVEHQDLMPAYAVGETNPRMVKKGICAAGHKAHYHEEWRGLPSQSFIIELGKRLGIRDVSLNSLIDRLYTSTCNIVAAGDCVGYLKKEFADKFRLSDKVAVSAGAFDAHLGAVGAGVGPGIFSTIMGTSTCDMMVGPVESEVLIPGICGQVRGSIIPGMVGYEAGQSSAGDTLRFMRNLVLRSWSMLDDNEVLRATDSQKDEAYEFLTRNAEGYGPRDVSITATDYFNGIRSPDMDPNGRGMLLGLTLEHKPGHIYRALVEAVAFGARAIMERFEQYGLPIEEVVACGGMAKPFVTQIHADITGRPFKISSVKQTCALGSAMAASVAAGVYPSIEEAQAAMNPLETRFGATYEPDKTAKGIYDRKFLAYQDARKRGVPIVSDAMYRMAQI